MFLFKELYRRRANERGRIGTAMVGDTSVVSFANKKELLALTKSEFILALLNI